MKFLHALVAVLLLAPIAAIAAAPPLVNPVTLILGGPAVHLTPHAYDAAGGEVPISISQCAISNVATTLATITYDATGALLTAVNTGSAPVALWKCTNGGVTVQSAPFTVTVPWSVVSVGDTSP